MAFGFVLGVPEIRQKLYANNIDIQSIKQQELEQSIIVITIAPSAKHEDHNQGENHTGTQISNNQAQRQR